MDAGFAGVGIIILRPTIECSRMVLRRCLCQKSAVGPVARVLCPPMLKLTGLSVACYWPCNQSVLIETEAFDRKLISGWN